MCKIEDTNYVVHKSDDEEEEEYCGDDPQNDILELLQEVESTGTFSCSGDCDPFMCIPRLKIEGIDKTIGLPLSTVMAKVISSVCEQAPYGKGEHTVVDTSVRNPKQLNPSKFQVTNPNFETGRIICIQLF